MINEIVYLRINSVKNSSLSHIFENAINKFELLGPIKGSYFYGDEKIRLEKKFISKDEIIFFPGEKGSVFLAEFLKFVSINYEEIWISLWFKNEDEIDFAQPIDKNLDNKNDLSDLNNLSGLKLINHISSILYDSHEELKHIKYINKTSNWLLWEADFTPNENFSQSIYLVKKNYTIYETLFKVFSAPYCMSDGVEFAEYSHGEKDIEVQIFLADVLGEDGYQIVINYPTHENIVKDFCEPLIDKSLLLNGFQAYYVLSFDPENISYTCQKIEKSENGISKGQPFIFDGLDFLQGLMSE